MLRFKDLKKFVEENPNHNSESPVMIQRITETELGRLSSVKVVSSQFLWAVAFNQEMDKEYQRRINGDETSFTLENPQEEKYTTEQLQEFKDTFHECRRLRSDGNIIYINLTS